MLIIEIKFENDQRKGWFINLESEKEDIIKCSFCYIETTENKIKCDYCDQVK
jgi:aspartate carbamoyltransferase regulatory subunit